MASSSSASSKALSLKRRTQSILKKSKELSILCGIDVATIVFEGPDSLNMPRIYPEDPLELLRILHSYKHYVDTHDPQNPRRKRPPNPIQPAPPPDHPADLRDREMIQGDEQLQFDHPTMDCLSSEQCRQLVAALDHKMAVVEAAIRELNRQGEAAIRCGGGDDRGQTPITDSASAIQGGEWRIAAGIDGGKPESEGPNAKDVEEDGDVSCPLPYTWL